MLDCFGLLDGAGGRGRTGIGLPLLDFESSASTNFTTPAIGGIIVKALVSVKGEISGMGKKLLTPETWSAIKRVLEWGCSSVGRALEWHSRGRQFDPDQLHQRTPPFFGGVFSQFPRILSSMPLK